MTRLHAIVFTCCSLLTVEALAQSCPGLSTLASSCRNGSCQAGLGEDANNCPEDCADPSTQIMSFYTQGMTCPPTSIYEPATVPELQDKMRELVSSGRRVRPAGSSHSATDIICANGDGDILRTKKLKAIGPVESFESHSHTVEFEAGVRFHELQENLAAQGYSFGLAATGYGGITIAGGVATGAHGSSLLTSSTISSYVVGMDVVGADGNLTTYTEGTTGVSDPNLWKALKTNMGLLGTVARLRLKLEPQFNLNVEVKYQTEANFVAPGGVANTIAGCDYVFLSWFPGEDTVQYLCGNRTSDPVDSPYAQNRLFTPDLSDFETFFAIPILQAGMCDNATACFTESNRVNLYQTDPPLVIADSGAPNAGVASRHTELTGPAHRMITLNPAIFFQQPALSQLEFEGAMPLSQVQAAVQYLKSIYDRDDVCQPLIGTLMRFDVADGNLLMSGNHARTGVAPGEQMVHLEFVEYWGYDADQAVFDNYIASPYEEIVDYLITNFNFWPHWGKNDEWVFEHPTVKARNAPERAIFNQKIAQLDPYGVFSNQSSRRAGFSSPQYGQPFAQAIYGNCAAQDSDGDGISNCTDRYPNNYSGMYVRIDSLGAGGGFFNDGSCNKADDWNEMKNNFGADQQQNMAAGWDYDSENHTYTSGTFNWSPSWPNGGVTSWEAMFSAEFVADRTGRYCFSVDSGATGTSIVDGWNGCAQAYINKQRVAEVGYNASWQPQGCVDLVQDQTYRLDLYNRHHNANVWRSFISRPRWCFGGEANCTPDRQFEQNQLKAISSL